MCNWNLLFLFQNQNICCGYSRNCLICFGWEVRKLFFLVTHSCLGTCQVLCLWRGLSYSYISVREVRLPFRIYYVMKYRKILFKYNAYISQPWKYNNLYFHSSENTRFDIFTGEKPQDWNYFFLFSQYSLREATLYGIPVSFLRETTIGVSYKLKVRVA